MVSVFLFRWFLLFRKFRLRLFRFGRFARFGRFIGFVSLVSLVFGCFVSPFRVLVHAPAKRRRAPRIPPSEKKKLRSLSVLPRRPEKKNREASPFSLAVRKIVYIKKKPKICKRQKKIAVEEKRSSLKGGESYDN